MKLKHPAVKSDVFKLIATLEFDLELNNHFLPTRVELFQDTERKNRFRCRLWERELCRVRMTLPATGASKIKHPASDEEILVERTWELSDEFEDFEAATRQQAMRLFLDSLKGYLGRLVVVNDPA
jgi:hypothetical protein